MLALPVVRAPAASAGKLRLLGAMAVRTSGTIIAGPASGGHILTGCHLTLAGADLIICREADLGLRLQFA